MPHNYDEILGELLELQDPPLDLRWHHFDGIGFRQNRQSLMGSAQIEQWQLVGDQQPPFDLETRHIIEWICFPEVWTQEARGKNGDVSPNLNFGVFPMPVSISSCAASVATWRQFEGICSRAGSLLPPDLRTQLAPTLGPFNQRQSAIWIALIFAWCDCVDIHRFQRCVEVTLWKPVMESIAAIGRIRAERDRGEFPTPRASGGNGDAKRRELEADAYIRLLSVFTNNISDERIAKAVNARLDNSLTVDQKLTKIDSCIKIPATASAGQLANMLKVSRTAVKKTKWWKENRHGKHDELIDRRKTTHRQRATSYESDKYEGSDS